MDQIIDIIPAEEKDIPTVAKIHRNCILKVNSKDYGQDLIDVWTKEISEDNIKQQLNNSKWIVAKINNEISGFAQYSLNNGYIYQINVSPKFIRQGIGKKLFQYIEKEFQQSHIPEIKLNSTITALEFYRSLGFETTEKIDFPIGNHSLEMYRMVKKL